MIILYSIAKNKLLPKELIMWLVFTKFGKDTMRVSENIECKRISVECSDYGINPDQNQLKHYNPCIYAVGFEDREDEILIAEYDSKKNKWIDHNKREWDSIEIDPYREI